MPMRALWLLLIVLLLSGATLSFAADPRMPNKTDRCPVCGMFVAPYPEWVATIQFKDDSQLFFDGAKDLFKYYFALPTKDDPRTREQIRDIFLTDYYTMQLRSAGELYLIRGSDVYGPMGHELVPVAGEEAAKTFARDHGSTHILTLDQLTPELLPED